MRYFILALTSTLLLSTFAFAFEIDGLRSGMSIEEARKVLEGFSYQKIEIKGNSLMAFDQEVGSDRAINATFCKGKLVQAQKHLKPRFDDFVRLVLIAGRCTKTG